jgi:hypothetical protein
MERGREIDFQDCVPLGGREFLHRRGELDAGIVDEDVEPSELFDRRLDQAAHGICLRHVGAVIEHAHAMVALKAAAELFDLGGVAKTVQHDVGAEPGELPGDAEPDAAGRSGDDGYFALQHGSTFQYRLAKFAAWPHCL